MSLPLDGLRVIAVEQYGAGPWGTLFLADLGAEVIKVENPRENGEVGRSVGPHFMAPGDSQFFQTFNRNKKSVTLDLKQPGARQVLRDLVRGADALFDNLRGDLPAKLGLTYDALKADNPKLVCAHLSAYGRSGARASWPGYDYLMQAEAGHMSLTGDPDGPPSKFGLSVVDLTTGLAAAFALLAGVTSARATGVGRDIDVNLFDTALHMLNYPGTWYLNAGVVENRRARSAHPSLTPSQLYRTRDGWIMIMCNKEHFFRTLAAGVGHPEWADDPRFANFAARLTHRDELTRLLDDALMADTTANWLARLAGRVPVAPVNDVAQALDGEFAAQQQRVVEYRYADGGSVRMVACPVTCPGETLPARAAPPLGRDTEAVLAGIGYDATRIAALRREGVI